MNPVEKFDHPDHGWVWRDCEIDWINARIEKAVAAEREACAVVCVDRQHDRCEMHSRKGPVTVTTPVCNKCTASAP